MAANDRERQSGKIAVARRTQNGNQLLAPSSDRRDDIVRLAARLFAERGYPRTSMRDIADAAGILAGSLYHHFKSKDALYLEAHGLAMTEASARLRAAYEHLHDPWDRLRAACVEHVRVQSNPASITANLMNDLGFLNPDLQRQIIAQRDKWEQLYREIVADLPLPPAIDRDLYRVLLLVQLNGVAGWYRPGRLTPEDIAAQIAALFHHKD